MLIFKPRSKRQKNKKLRKRLFELILTEFSNYFTFVKYCQNSINQNSSMISIKCRNDPIADIFSRVIGGAWFCDKLHINVEFQFIGGDNLFENSVIIFSDEHKSKSHTNTCHLKMHRFATHHTKFSIPSEYGHKIISKLAIKKKIMRQTEQWINNNLDGNQIGIHYRGTDAQYTVKSRYIEVEKYVAYLKKVLDTQCNIFACSDQEQFIDQIHAAFPGRVFSRGIIRSRDKTSLHRNSKYAGPQQKEDALTDLLILSKASLVYTNGSYFVDVVRFLNPTIKIISLDGREACYPNIPNYLPSPKL